MSFVELLLIALALAADAFTVGVAVGLGHRRPRQRFRLSFHFGLFQALLPLAGAFLGWALDDWIGGWDHWVGFALLAFIGGRMVRGAFDEQEDQDERDLTKGLTMVGLSIAVSIDAFAVGFTLGLRDVSIVFAVSIIGVVAAAATLVGMLIAGRVGKLLGKRVEIVAGLVLIGLGVKMLAEGLC
jgi:putative Mn2+ efflux pump MntP